jgi:hypothetical protein
VTGPGGESVLSKLSLAEYMQSESNSHVVRVRAGQGGGPAPATESDSHCRRPPGGAPRRLSRGGTPSAGAAAAAGRLRVACAPEPAALGPGAPDRARKGLGKGSERARIELG